MSENIKETYTQMFDRFLQTESNHFLSPESLVIMKQNFEKQEGRLVTKPCDVRPLFVPIDQETMITFLSQAVDDILSPYMEQKKEYYRTLSSTFHISMALFQDVRPCDMTDPSLLAGRLTRDQVDFLEKLVDPLFKKHPTFFLRLHSLCIGDNGSLAAFFLDQGEFFSLQGDLEETLKMVSFIPKRKYKKNLIHVTLARLFEEVDEGTLSLLKEKIKQYKDLRERSLSVEVRSIILEHEVRWMHEAFAPGERKVFYLKQV